MRLLKYLSCLLPCLLLHGNPLEVQTVLGFADMDQDGDLVFRARLTETGVAGNLTFDVVLEHRLVVSDYGRSGSRLCLRPLETCVWEKSENEMTWERPGGGAFTTGKNKSPEGYVFSGGLEDRVEVSRQGWTLVYSKGNLSGIKLPSGDEVECQAQGNRVCSLSRQGEAILTVTWSESGNPESLKTADGRYVFVEDDEGRITEVLDDTIGAPIMRFHYDERGLLVFAKCRGRPDTVVRWRENKGFGRGNSFYRKPFSVAQVNKVAYEYVRDGNRVLMRKSATGKSETIRWESLNGKIVFITNK
jgi:hypothetical protein